ncbi:MAG: SAM-dependent methyltransferase [Streptosporangiaceae bacterium]
MNDRQPAPPGVDVSKPSPARMYDRYLGGTANFPADREAVDRILELVPEIRDAAWANRGFLQRAVRWMAQRGIRQFIDLGAGLPTQRSTHEVAREVTPDSTVVYTDRDPSVIAHGGELLADVPGAAVIEADFRRPEELLAHPVAGELIDFAAPVGLLIVAVTQFVADAEDPWGLVARYVKALAAGSYLALSAPTADHMVDRKIERIVDVYATSTIPSNTPRARAEIEQFFAGLVIVPPYRGAAPELTSAGLWDCEDPETAESDGSRSFYVGVARKPPSATSRVAKPTIEELRIGANELVWRRSPEGPGAIEVAFARTGREEWVLMRLTDDLDRRISVFIRFEWDCFLDGVRNGEFDDAAS